MKAQELYNSLLPIAKRHGWPEVGVVFGEDPKNETVEGEIYLWNIPTQEHRAELLMCLSHLFPTSRLELTSNVITIYYK